VKWLALTPGEPAGIGPDLCVQLAARGLASGVVCFADPDLLAARAREIGGSVTLHPIDDLTALAQAPHGALWIYPIRTASRVKSGVLDVRNAPYVLSCLDAALAACVRGELAGLVTGPVQKSIINDAGIAFSGHTEYLAERLGGVHPVMMLVADTLRVALVTTHVALRDVPRLITCERVAHTIEAVHAHMRTRYGLANPRVGVCGLNPHAGEGGHLGVEDRDEIAPAVAALAARGWQVSGPLPADTLFVARQRAQFDAIVAMYHDQGLTALKALGFGAAVNVTLGLPIVRTSVDHGTALDLAGSGRADSGSLEAALTLAARLCGGPS